MGGKGVRGRWDEKCAWQEGCRCALCISTLRAAVCDLGSQNSVLHRAYAARQSKEVGVANMQSTDFDERGQAMHNVKQNVNSMVVFDIPSDVMH